MNSPPASVRFGRLFSAFGWGQLVRLSPAIAVAECPLRGRLHQIA